MLDVICSRLRPGHLSVRVGDGSRRSEEIVKHLELGLWMRLLFFGVYLSFLPKGCNLVVVGGLVSRWPWELCWRETCLLVGTPMSDRSRGRDQTKSTHWSSGLGVRIGLTTPFYKKETVTETATATLEANLVEEESSRVELMMRTGETPRIKTAGITWAELQRTSQNRVPWRGVVAALCSTRNQEA